MRIKVCGMKFQENTAEVILLQPDYLGFIFWEHSPRYFAESSVDVQAPIKKVGVFVDAPIDLILEKISTMHLELIQLHGQETPEYCTQLKKSLDHQKNGTENSPEGIKIIKAISIGSSFSFGELKSYEPHVDYFLFDTKGPLPGGNGYAFDWELLAEYSLKTPFFLSGGIGLGDTAKLKEFMMSPVAGNCHAIDVNSRFELAPGLKNTEDLGKFIKEIKEIK